MRICGVQKRASYLLNLIKGSCELLCGFWGTDPGSSAKEGSDFSCESISLAPLQSDLNSHTRCCIRYHSSKTSNNCMIGQDAPRLGLGIEDSFLLEDKAFFFSLLVVITPAIWLCLLPNEWCSSDTHCGSRSCLIHLAEINFSPLIT